MKSKFFCLLLLLLTFIVTLPISWWGLAKVDFFYSILHDSIGIDQHIKKYAPRNNKNKNGFEKTTKAERVELFHGVVTAVHNDGKGLETLFYNPHNSPQKPKQKVVLFTDAEVLHLKDVAILLDKLKPVILVVIMLWIVLLFMLHKKRARFPSGQQFLMSAFLLIVISAIVLSFGPEKLFNQLHIWAFPDNHQWFFYYEDSLMSTMMKAPHLFAYISAIWVFISVMLTMLLIKLMRLIRTFERY